MYSKVCPWTLFLTMSLTLLKGLMPHVPQMLPLLVTDPEMRSRAEETFMSPEFQENIEQYFVENIKVSLILHMYFLTSTLFFLKRLCFKIHKPFLGPSLSFVLCMNEWEKENIKTKERKKILSLL